MLQAKRDESLRIAVRHGVSYAFGPVAFALFIVLITLLEWLKYYWSVPPKPVVYLFVAVPVVGYAVFRFFRVGRVHGVRHNTTLLTIFSNQQRREVFPIGRDTYRAYHQRQEPCVTTMMSRS
jgi:hypothetical protein